MNPADLSVLIFLVAVPSVFVFFLWLFWSMARRSRAQMGRYIEAQGSLDPSDRWMKGGGWSFPSNTAPKGPKL